MLIVFTVLIEQIKRERYLDNDYLTPEQESILQKVKDIVCEYYPTTKEHTLLAVFTSKLYKQ